MIRTTNYILKYANQSKLGYLQQVYEDYRHDLQLYINLIIGKKLELKALLTSKDLPTFGLIEHSQWKQIIYKQASEIIRSNIEQLKKRRYSKFKKCYSYFSKNKRQFKFLNKRYNELYLKNPWPKSIEIKNISINIDERLLDTQRTTSGEFNEFINLKLPYFQKNKKRAIQIKLPIKYHKHSLQYLNWNRRKTIQLKKINNQFYFKVFFETDTNLIQNLNNKKERNNNLAFDLGYNKLIADSNGNVYGKDLKDIYKKINNKKQGSKNFKKLLRYRDNKIGQTINSIDLSDIKTLYLEDLKYLFKGKKYMKNIKRWTYSKVLNKLSLICEEQGINLIKVNPMFTSQTCSRCGTIDIDNRHNENYHCSVCNLEIDADINAAINILRKGVYNPSNIEKQKVNKELL